VPSLLLGEAQVVRVGAGTTHAIFFRVAGHQADLQELEASLVAQSVQPLPVAP